VLLDNQRGEASSPLSIDTIKRSVMDFLREDAGFAQLITLNTEGYPVGRTVVASINEDWTVDLVQRSVHARIGQWRRDPRTEIIWSGSPHRSNRNLRPHVFDWCVQIPRVVFLRGEAEFMTDRELVTSFNAQCAANLAAGRDLAPMRDRSDITSELIGVHIRPVQVRAEGFGMGAESWTWRCERS